MDQARTAIIIGAGPAGLTAAHELLTSSEIKPIILEAADAVGGISRTVVHNGNRIDIGGHRFFSKSDRVMEWWQSFMPVQGKPSRDDLALGRDPAKGSRSATAGPDPETTDRVLLIRERLSRIFFLRRLFDYPVSLSVDTIRGLGPVRIARILASYLRAAARPVRPEKTLEDFFINRFGRVLYEIFFQDYTEKVWGLPCAEIRPEWGAQRVKGLSIAGTLRHAARKLFGNRGLGVEQKATETSLIERFLYPKLGPGQLWELVAASVVERGGSIHLGQRVVGVQHEGSRVVAVDAVDAKTGERTTYRGDFVLSTMAIKDLVAGWSPSPPSEVAAIAAGLPYRDFITVGLLVRRLRLKNRTRTRSVNDLIPDNWIYIQERDVRLGRLQIFNNWSPYLVADPNTVWLGLEYFCQEGDDLWRMEDAALQRFAARELASIGIIDQADVLDGVVLRVAKTYPAYFGTYDRFDDLRAYLDAFDNLFLIGRNGMHRYNNADHSMLTAMVAVECICGGTLRKSDLWQVNAEPTYHEEK